MTAKVLPLKSAGFSMPGPTPMPWSRRATKLRATDTMLPPLRRGRDMLTSLPTQMWPLLATTASTPPSPLSKILYSALIPCLAAMPLSTHGTNARNGALRPMPNSTLEALPFTAGADWPNARPAANEAARPPAPAMA